MLTDAELATLATDLESDRVERKETLTAGDEERLLTEKRRYGNLSFDQRGMPGARLDHLDLDFFRRRILPAILAPDVLAANNRTIEEQLAAAHFLTPDGLPTVAALLLCGNDPQYWIPGAHLQFVRFDGDDVLAPIIDEQALRGTLVDQLRLLDDLLRLNIRTAIEVGDGLQEVRRPDYPLIALQQLGRNALMHRNYETSNAPVQLYWFADRVEIHNPGSLFGRTTPETFGRIGGNDYRNQTLASFFKALGFVQTFGLGIPLARRACADNQNPPPEFAFQPGTFGAIVRKRG